MHGDAFRQEALFSELGAALGLRLPLHKIVAGWLAAHSA